jgi:hypothetical protein
VLPGAGQVALVEHQVDHGEDFAYAVRQFEVGGDAVGNAGVADLLLSPSDAPGHGRFRDEEGSGDLGGGQPAHGAQGERDLRGAW